MSSPAIDLTVYPDACDTYGHLNQAAFLTLFERARWEMLVRGPGMDLFSRTGSWPAVRKATIEYLTSAFPGDVLRFTQTLLHLGRTSFTLRQIACRLRDQATIAIAESVFVCIDQQGRVVPVPEALGRYLNEPLADPEARCRHVTVNGVSLAVEIAGDGPAILFIHGYPLDRSIWRDQMNRTVGWRRIAPDLRGFGASDAPDLGYSLATYAEDLIALLDAVGVAQVVTVLSNLVSSYGEDRYRVSPLLRRKLAGAPAGARFHA